MARIKGEPELRLGPLTGPGAYREPRDEFVFSTMRPTIEQISESWAIDGRDPSWVNPASLMSQDEFFDRASAWVKVQALPWEQKKKRFQTQVRILVAFYFIAKHYGWSRVTQHQIMEMTKYRQSTVRKVMPILARKGLVEVLNKRREKATSYRLLLVPVPQKPKGNPNPWKAREALAEKRKAGRDRYSTHFDFQKSLEGKSPEYQTAAMGLKDALDDLVKGLARQYGMEAPEDAEEPTPGREKRVGYGKVDRGGAVQEGRRRSDRGSPGRASGEAGGGLILPPVLPSKASAISRGVA